MTTELDTRLDAALAHVRPESLGQCLITGGAGYLGQFLSRALLRRGAAVRVFDLNPSPVDGVESLVGDICDGDAVARAVSSVDTVFHAAAVINLLGIAKPSVKRAVEAVNVEATQGLLTASMQAGVRRFVYTSTVNVILDRAVSEADESERYAESFVDLYTETKTAAERAVLQADDPEGMRTVALRPGGLWGPGDGGLMIQAFLTQLAKGRFSAVIGDGTAVVDNTHTHNLVAAEVLAASAAADTVGGKAYFITDNDRINGVEWFRPLVVALGQTWPKSRVAPWLAYRFAHVSEMLHRVGLPEPIVTRIGVLKLTRTSSVRIDRARKDLGYEPLMNQARLLDHRDDYRAVYESLGGSPS